jgi:hypothetical protein
MPAAAQTVTGTVTLTGSVAPKCSVIAPPGGTTFARSVNFNELSQADGTLRTGLSADFAAAVTAVTLVCNTNTPQVTVTSLPLATATAAAAGYDNSIDYTAHVAVSKAGGGTTTVDDDTIPAAGTGPTAVGGALLNGSNVAITADNFRTNAATDILVAGSYSGTITIVITPV